MDKLLAHIDIAQEDGTQNPSAAHSRVKAKTNGQLVSRSPAGVESALGGGLQLVSVVLGSRFPNNTGSSLVPVTPLSISIPAGKSARVSLLLANILTGASSISVPVGGGFRIQNTAAAGQGNLSGSVSGKATPAGNGAASAGALYDGDVFSIAPGASLDFTVASSVVAASNAITPTAARLSILNPTNSAALITPLAAQYTNTNASAVEVGSAIFALIS